MSQTRPTLSEAIVKTIVTHMKARLFKSLLSLWIIVFVAGCAGITQTPPSTPSPTPMPILTPTSIPTSAPLTSSATYWPTQGWRTSTPEQQGMDSEMLARMLENIKTSLHSLLIIRHGYIVTEAYFYPFRQNDQHMLVCATKSFLSALTGIALNQGYIGDVGQRLLDFFPQRIAADNDSRKASITLGYLLANKSGLAGDDRAYFEMLQSNDWLQFALDLPISAEPGTRFNYFTINSYLLSAVLQAKIDQEVESFAQKNLLEPLGISDAYWGTDPDGRLIPTDLQLSTRDMAKLGYLYLHQGVWDGQQIVPAEWVAASTQAQPGTEGYGYQWWVWPFGYAAEGGWEQCIFVIPEQDMVVVSTGGLIGSMCADTALLIASDIIPAATSPEPLPENLQAAARLESLSEQLGQPPAPQPVPSLPATASALAGKTFLLEENALGWQAFALEFQEPEAQLTLLFNDQPQKLTIGLDNVYHITAVEQVAALHYGITLRGPVALKGVWQDETTFSATAQFLNGNVLGLRFGFDQDNVTVRVIDLLRVGFAPDQNISGTLQK